MTEACRGAFGIVEVIQQLTIAKVETGVRKRRTIRVLVTAVPSIGVIAPAADYAAPFCCVYYKRN